MAHPYLDFPISVADLHAVDWNAVLNAATRRCWPAYFDALNAELKLAHQQGDQTRTRVFALLTEVTRFNVEYSSREPFSVAMHWNGFSTPAPRDLSVDQQAVLREAIATSQDAEFRCHVSDLLWCVDKSIGCARDAIGYYEQAAADMTAALDWLDRLDRYERAIVLSLQINERLKTIHLSGAMEALIVTHQGDSAFPTPAFVGLLLRHGFGAANQYAPLVQAMAQNAEASGAWLVAKDHWAHAAAWWKKAGDHHAVALALKNGAEALRSEAFGPRGMSKNPPDPLYASGHLTAAIEAFRSIPGQKQRVTELTTELLELQRGIPGSLHQIKTEAIDIRGLQQIAVASVTGGDALSAVLRFCLVADIPVKDAVSTRAKGMFRGAFSELFQTNYINQAGRTVARKDPTFSVQGAVDAAALEVAASGLVSQEWGLLCAAQISPAFDQVTLEHVVSAKSLIQILDGSWLIPHDRLALFVEGFRQGFAGNMLAANSILVPQVENSLRHLLESRGVIATKLDSELIQDEKDLNQLLDFQELSHSLGTDVVFNLKSLLVSRYGANFRNRLSHGLLSPGHFVSEPASLFFFWLWFRLCAAHAIATYLRCAERYQSEARSRLETAVRERAFFIYEERVRAGVPGVPEDDWKAAERELCKAPINCAP